MVQTARMADIARPPSPNVVTEYHDPAKFVKVNQAVPDELMDIIERYMNDNGNHLTDNLSLEV